MKIDKTSARVQSARPVSAPAERIFSAHVFAARLNCLQSQSQSQPRTADPSFTEWTSSDKIDLFAVSYYNAHVNSGGSRPTDFSVASNLLGIQNKGHREKHQYAALAHMTNVHHEQRTTTSCCTIF